MDPSIKNFPFLHIGQIKLNVNAIALALTNPDGSISIRLTGGGKIGVNAKDGPAVSRLLKSIVFPDGSAEHVNIAISD